MKTQFINIIKESLVGICGIISFMSIVIMTILMLGNIFYVLLKIIELLIN